MVTIFLERIREGQLVHYKGPLLDSATKSWVEKKKKLRVTLSLLIAEVGTPEELAGTSTSGLGGRRHSSRREWGQEPIVLRPCADNHSTDRLGNQVRVMVQQGNAFSVMTQLPLYLWGIVEFKPSLIFQPQIFKMRTMYQNVLPNDLHWNLRLILSTVCIDSLADLSFFTDPLARFSGSTPLFTNVHVTKVVTTFFCVQLSLSRMR